MKYCPNCGTQLDDNAVFCSKCGHSFNGQAAPAAPAAPAADPADHTAEFTQEDISKNKLYAIMAYLFSIFGILIAAICVKDSAYVEFHKRNALKLLIIELISAILMVIPILGWIAIAAICVICLVLRIIAIINIFCNKAKDLPILKSLKFLD